MDIMNEEEISNAVSSIECTNIADTIDGVQQVNASFDPLWKNHSTLTLLATQDLPTFLYYMIDPLKSWCWGTILFYPFKNSRFS
mgnify:CR=1 FL=1